MTTHDELLYSATVKNSEEVLEVQIFELWKNILGREDFGVHDNFFALGGYSIPGIRLISRLREKFSLNLRLSFFFEFPTIAEQARAIAAHAHMDNIPGPHRMYFTKCPLSYAQEGVWILEQMFPLLPMVLQTWAVRITGPFDEMMFQEALNEVVNRHESLRASVETENGEPLLYIHPERPVVLSRLDLRNDLTREEKAGEILKEEARRKFNLENDPLVRGFILRMEDQQCIVALTLHHFTCDGLSMEIFFRELASCYRSFVQGLPAPFFPLKIQFSDFAIWQKEGVPDSTLEKELQTSESYLKETPEPIPFPSFHDHTGPFTGKGAMEIRDLGSELTTRISILAEHQNSTIFQSLVTAFAVLLFRYTGQDKFLIGIPVAKRDRQELEPLIGRLSEVRLISVHLSGSQSFESLMKQLQENLKQAFSFQHLSLERLIREIHPKRIPLEKPLVQVLLNWRTSESRIETMDLNEARLEPLQIHRGTARFPISITFVEGSSGIAIELEYSTDLFDQKTVQMYLRHFENILRAAVSDSAQPLAALNLMDPEELESVTKNWNKTEKKFSEESFLQAFEKTVLIHGNEPAIVYGNDILSYSDLNHRANVLGRRLLDAGILPGKRVALCLEQTPDRILSILATWKAGGAFIPLDPEFPAKRLLFQLRESDPQVLITTSELKNRLFTSLSEFAVMLIDTNSFDQPCDNLNADADPDNLAYLMYTSGTTGRPKAVCVEHQSVTNLLDFTRELVPLKPGDRLFQFSPYTFDFMVCELLMALTDGAALIIDRKGGDLTHVLKQEKISHALFPPFVIAGLREELLPNLKTLLSGGEACPVHIANRWRKGRRFFNAYGPTEATAYSVIWEMTEESITGTVPIGRPVSNARTYILDHHFQPVPPGVTGELYLAGRPLSRGYWRNEDLTRERFIRHTLPLAGPELLYRTGDLARWRTDGNIEFIGRTDNQIKMRGIRIELAETQAILRQHPAIQDCIVIPIEITQTEQRLVAYYISREENLDPCEIQKFLADQLPRHLVPYYLVQIPEFPLNSNGKLDRKLLPAPKISKIEEKGSGPRNEIERIVATVWCEVLKKDRVGVNDDFFGVGGHSLLGVQIILRLRDLFGKHLPISAIFDSPTVAGLAEALSKEASVNHP